MPEFITDRKLPVDVVRKIYTDRRHALGCTVCAKEVEFDPLELGAIGKALLVLALHECPDHRE